MRHTLKWSFFIGTAAAGAVLALMKLFQPIRYEHLVIFGYAFVGTSLLAGYVAHKNLEKRNMNKTQSVKTDGGSAGFIGVQRVKIGGDGMKDNPKKEEETVPDFVPASKLLAEAGDFENNASDAAGGIAVAKSNPENEAENGMHRSAEKFLDEIEKEEVEKEIQKSEAVMNGNNAQHRADSDNTFLRHRGKRAKILTTCDGAICGKFAGMDTHVLLEDAECGPEKKSLLMISKSEIARMEID